MAGLVTFVAVRGDDGTVRSFGPGVDIPDWAAKQITNPQVWEGGETPASSLAGGATGDGPPPRAGKGSSEEKWRAYAASNGIDLPAAIDGRDDIIEFLGAAGVPVE